MVPGQEILVQDRVMPTVSVSYSHNSVAPTALQASGKEIC